jgi:hypothetical protein
MISGMADHGGSDSKAGHIRRSRLLDYVDTARPGTEVDGPSAMATPAHSTAPSSQPSETPAPSAATPPSAPPAEPADVAARRREFAVLLGEFRRTPVQLPLDEDEVPLTADYGGIRWIYAFSHEEALARFAIARGGSRREWAYQRVLGARLLDAAVPAVGVPCGVALDVGSPDGVLFPPVSGIVPDAAAVDVEHHLAAMDTEHHLAAMDTEHHPAAVDAAAVDTEHHGKLQRIQGEAPQ